MGKEESGYKVKSDVLRYVAPSTGALVIGGGRIKDPEIIKRFAELAGRGPGPICVIPTAAEDDCISESVADIEALMGSVGLDVRVLHTRDRDIANSETFTKPLRQSRGVWMPGGRHWRLADAYLHTRTHNELSDLLGRGGVIGGSSAGATIQSSFMIRGDTGEDTILIGDHTEGFSFLHDVCIDQHLLRRNRQHDLVKVIEQHRHLLGIGIDEDTAIVVQDECFEVIGQSYVGVYKCNPRHAEPTAYCFLAPGDHFSLTSRDIIVSDLTAGRGFGRLGWAPEN